MNEQLQTAMAELITGAVQTAETAKTFVLSELPGVVQQLLAWKFWQSLIGMICFIVAMTALIIIFVKLTKKAVKAEFSDEVPFIIGSFVSGLVALFSAIIYICEATPLTWLQICLAPKIYLIEYASELIN